MGSTPPRRLPSVSRGGAAETPDQEDAALSQRRAASRSPSHSKLVPLSSASDAVGVSSQPPVLSATPPWLRNPNAGACPDWLRDVRVSKELEKQQPADVDIELAAVSEAWASPAHNALHVSGPPAHNAL